MTENSNELPPREQKPPHRARPSSVNLDPQALERALNKTPGEWKGDKQAEERNANRPQPLEKVAPFHKQKSQDVTSTEERPEGKIILPETLAQGFEGGGETYSPEAQKKTLEEVKSVPTVPLPQREELKRQARALNRLAQPETHTPPFVPETEEIPGSSEYPRATFENIMRENKKLEELKAEEKKFDPKKYRPTKVEIPSQTERQKGAYEGTAPVAEPHREAPQQPEPPAEDRIRQSMQQTRPLKRPLYSRISDSIKGLFRR